MYYKRFNRSSLDSALVLGKISTELHNRIENFYDRNIMYIKKECYESLLRVLPKLKTVGDGGEETMLVEVLDWPHCKPMCLLFSPSNPHLWRYMCESDMSRVLFDYNIEHGVVHPPSTLSNRPA